MQEQTQKELLKEVLDYANNRGRYSYCSIDIECKHEQWRDLEERIIKVLESDNE